MRDETSQRPAGNVLQGEDGVQVGREAVFECDYEWMPAAGAERRLLSQQRLRSISRQTREKLLRLKIASAG